MAAKKNDVQLQVPVVLSPGSFEFLEKNAKGDVIATLAGWTRHWMDQQSRGGLMLAPEDHDTVAEYMGGKRFSSSRQLAAAVAKGLNRDEGQHSFQVNVDPAYYPAFKENAKAAGLTEEESMDGIVQYIMSNGMIYDFSPADGRSIPFTGDMIESCKALCEKHKVDSSDIAGLIAENRLLPITREMKAKAAALYPEKAELKMSDYDAILDRLAVLEKENAELRKAPREVVAA